MELNENPLLHRIVTLAERWDSRCPRLVSLFVAPFIPVIFLVVSVSEIILYGVRLRHHRRIVERLLVLKGVRSLEAIVPGVENHERRLCRMVEETILRHWMALESPAPTLDQIVYIDSIAAGPVILRDKNGSTFVYCLSPQDCMAWKLTIGEKT